MLHYLTHFHEPKTSSVGGGCIFITIYTYHHLIYHWPTCLFQITLYYNLIPFLTWFINMKTSFSNVHWWLIIYSVCILSNLMYCIHKNEWMLLTQEPTFVIFMVVTQEPTIRKQVKEMTGVSTRTNICCSHGCHTRTNHN